MKTKLVSLQIGLLLAVPSLMPAHAQQTVDAFVRFLSPAKAGFAFRGESTDRQFPSKDGWSRITALSWGGENKIDLAAGIMQGKPSASSFTFSKSVDRGSTVLFQSSMSGQPYQFMEFVVRKKVPGHAAQPYFRAQMQDVFITSLAWSADSSQASAQEDVKVVFGGLQWSYTMVDPTGAALSTNVVHWDLVQNQIGSGPLPTIIKPATITAVPHVQSTAIASDAIQPAHSIDSGPLETLRIERLNNSLQLSYTSAVPGEVRLQATSSFAPGDWQNLDVTSDSSPSTAHRWALPVTGDSPAQWFFRVIRQPSAEKASNPDASTR